MSNILPVNNTVASSADQTVGSTGQVLLFLTDSDGGYSSQEAQVNIVFKAASGQYMRQGNMGFNQPSYLLCAVPGVIFRVDRIAGNVGVDAVGQV